jgi:hypothetical protein
LSRRYVGKNAAEWCPLNQNAVFVNGVKALFVEFKHRIFED